MASIFRKDDNSIDKPKRNTFDLSFANSLTLKMGEIVPVFCKEVLPGDSFRIKPNFGFRYLPQVFPIQTRQRAGVKFYYVRNRTLWKDWMDFIGKTKTGLVQPYIQFDEDDYQYYLRPSGLCDYMGVPVKVNVPYGSRKTFGLSKPWVCGKDYSYIPESGDLVSNSSDPMAILKQKSIATQLWLPNDYSTVQAYALNLVYGGIENVSDSIIPAPNNVVREDYVAQDFIPHYQNILWSGFRRAFVPTFPLSIKVAGTPFYLIVRTSYGDVAISSVYDGAGVYSLQLLSNKVDAYVGTNVIGLEEVEIQSIVGILSVTAESRLTFTDYSVNVEVSSNDDVFWCDLSIDELPYASTKYPDRIRLNALPFRGIQAIYNALIRNPENNPLIIDGQPEYNQYVLSEDGGADNNINQLLRTYLSNWSDDRFTTSLPSPQQGNAPLVGLTGVNGATVVLGNEDGTQSTVHLQVDSDTGNVVMVDSVSSDSPDYLNDAMMSAVEYGITINDLRNVNSFQRWLENNIRHGYKYKDQLLSHYGVSARYDVLDMPEFIGGVTRDVSVNQITQTVKNEYGELGDYGGQSYVMGDGKEITHYCDEHGFIIGLMDVRPMPLYTDALPKHLIKADPFDYYFPEFGKIGMQPITNKELEFSLSVVEEKQDSTFGYQRAWYDYLESLDEVHGEFRMSPFNGFIMSRQFASMPELGSNFLTVDSDDINNTFYSEDDNDKIVGQLYFDVKAKRPLPLVGIPALE